MDGDIHVKNSLSPVSPNPPNSDELDLEPTTISHSRTDYTFPEGGLRAWLVIFGSFSIISGTFGLLSSIGLFQSYWQENQLSTYTPRDIGWISAINVFLNLFLGVQIGPLFDRYGPRYIVFSGSVVYVVSLFILAQCNSYWQFMLVYGVLAGASSACITTSALAVVAHWFEKRRGVASGIVFMGSSVGGILFPLVLKTVFETVSWGNSVRIVAGIVGFFMVIGNLCIRGRLPPKGNGGAVDLRCYADPRFSLTTIGVACFESVFFGVIGLLPTYIIKQGFRTQTSFNIIAILNAGSAFGRITSGYFSDSYGRFNTMILTLLFSLLATLTLWLPFTSHLTVLYIFAPLFGFGSGSIISMAPVCLGQLCKADQYGEYYGTSYSAVAFATMVCIPVGGELLPVLGAKGFVGFFGGGLGLSLGAFLVARWACLGFRWKWFAIV